MLIVDNLAHSFGFQLENGIPILEYHNDQNDSELKYLIDYLLEAVKHDDLREYNKKLRLDDMIEFNIEEWSDYTIYMSTIWWQVSPVILKYILLFING